MSDPDDSKAARRRPKRKRKQSNRAKGRFELLEELLRQPVQIMVNQKPRKMPALRAIVLRLLEKSTKGHKKPNRLLAKYIRFAHSHSLAKRIELKFSSEGSIDDVSSPEMKNDHE